MTDLANKVRQRAAGLCEYCRLPESAFRRTFHIEHIIAKQHHGLTMLENLALACWSCNLKKGPNIAGIDPESGQITDLFHPRKDKWESHFVLDLEKSFPSTIEVTGLTQKGRTTVKLLSMNSELRRRIRYELWREGKLFDSVRA